MATSKSMEDRLALLKPHEQEEFQRDCQDIFSANAGQRVLVMLTRLCHPMASPLRESDRDTFAEIGRKEVVSLLWRRRDTHNQPPQNSQT